MQHVSVTFRASSETGIEVMEVFNELRLSRRHALSMSGIGLAALSLSGSGALHAGAQEATQMGNPATPMASAPIGLTHILSKNEDGAGEHDEIGASFLFSQRVFDWLDETLATVD